MRIIIFFCLIILTTELQSQALYLQIEQVHGVSSYVPNHMHYKIKYSFQYGANFGIDFSRRIDARIGFYYHNAGASDSFLMNAELPRTKDNSIRQTYNSEYLKIPFDINLKLGNNELYFLSLGFYFNINVGATYSTESETGLLLPSLTIESLSQDDFGIRLRSGINIPINSKSLFQVGILQEFGFNQFWFDMRNYDTNVFIAYKFLIKPQHGSLELHD